MWMVLPWNVIVSSVTAVELFACACAVPSTTVWLCPAWTLSSELSWSRTNRLAGWLMIVAGAMLLLAGLLGSTLLMVATVAATVFGALGLIAYSYRVWAADPNKNSADPI